MPRARPAAFNVVTEEIGRELARLIHRSCSQLDLRLYQFGGVARFWSTPNDRWAEITPALLVLPQESRPATLGTNQRLTETDDVFRILYVVPVSDEDPHQRITRDVKAIVLAIAADTLLSAIANDLLRDEQATLSGAFLDAIEWEPPENVELTAAAQPYMAAAIRWRQRWRSLRAS